MDNFKDETIRDLRNQIGAMWLRIQKAESRLSSETLFCIWKLVGTNRDGFVFYATDCGETFVVEKQPFVVCPKCSTIVRIYG